MSYVEIETGSYVKRWAFWNPATWSIPKLYWDAWSQEQRLHAICRQLEKVIAYADYVGVNVDDIAQRLKAIEEGQLDPIIVAAIEAWFEDNEPTIVNSINALNEALPIGSYDENNTVEDALTALAALLPATDFDSVNTVSSKLSALDGYQLKTFETVNDLIDCEDFENGEFARTIQYHANTSYGGCVYKLTTASVNSASFITDSGLYATPIFDSNTICISKLGAKDYTDSTTAIQTAFDIAYSGCEILFDVLEPRITQQVTLASNNVTLKSIAQNYKYIHTSVANDYAILINSHGCTLDGLQFTNDIATDISDVRENEKCIRMLDLVSPVFYNCDSVVKNCIFVLYGNCLTVYGKNCTINGCTFTNSINAINLIGSYDGVDTVQRRGLWITECDFHGGSIDFIRNVGYNDVKAIAVKNQGGFREIVISNNVFTSEYCGYIFKGSSGGLTISNNIAEDHTGCVGLAVISAREDGLSQIVSITGNRIDNDGNKTTDATVINPFVWKSTEMLVFSNNILRGFVNLAELNNGTVISFTNNNFLALANKYGSGLFTATSNTATLYITLVGNQFNGQAGSMPLLYSSTAYDLEVLNSNYLNANYINTTHFTTS